MPEAWREIAETCLGWLHPAEGPKLQEYANAAADLSLHLPMAEIGGYAGKSACWLGAVAKDRETLLYSIDWHRGSPEMALGRECHHPEMVDAGGMFDSLPHFRSNIRKAELEPWVVPVAGTSGQIGRFWGSPLSLLFIDGGHDGVTVSKDYELWGGLVVPGGFLLFHDATIPEIDAVAKSATSGSGPIRAHYEFIEQVDSLRVLRRR